MMMVMALMLTTSMTAFAATGSRTYKAASKMTITLNPGQRGNSNTVTIRVSDLPEDAIITKLTVNTGSMTYSGGAIVPRFLRIGCTYSSLAAFISSTLFLWLSGFLLSNIQR